MHDGDVVEHDAAHAAHRDPVLAADHRDVADGHVGVADDDAAQHDRAGRTDEPLTAVDVEGPVVDAGREPDGRRQVVPPDPAGGRERQADRRRERPAGDPELAALFGVAPAPRREQCLPEQLCPDPGAAEERERGDDRRADAEQQHGRHQRAELDQSERQSGPARLVGERRVVEAVGREADGDHQARELDRPPLAECSPECQRHG